MRAPAQSQACCQFARKESGLTARPTATGEKRCTSDFHTPRPRVGANVSRQQGAVMNRILIALLAAVSTAVMSEELRIVRLVDLDAPGALELVQREHPDHIIKIQRILREAPDQSPDEAPGWMRTQFGARGVGYGIL